MTFTATIYNIFSNIFCLAVGLNKLTQNYSSLHFFFFIPIENPNLTGADDVAMITEVAETLSSPAFTTVATGLRVEWWELSPVEPHDGAVEVNEACSDK